MRLRQALRAFWSSRTVRHAFSTEILRELLQRPSAGRWEREVNLRSASLVEEQPTESGDAIVQLDHLVIVSAMTNVRRSSRTRCRLFVKLGDGRQTLGTSGEQDCDHRERSKFPQGGH